jgi:hypothetical protein
MKEQFAGVAIFGILVVLVLLVVFGPLLTIWTLNTLFVSLAIPYTFWTWLAALVLNLSLAGAGGLSNK